MKILIQGASSQSEIPGIESLPSDIDVVFAPDVDSVGEELPGSEIILAWNFRDRELRQHWDKTASLKWVHWCGAGVDAALFSELKDSDVILTNAKGIFDRAMAETVLCYMLMVTKDVRKTLDHQVSKTWEYRMTRMLRGEKVLIIGVGSIGRDFAKLLNANGLECYGAGRNARSGDNEFREIYNSSNLPPVIAEFDWVIGIMPSTVETTEYFDQTFFEAMNPNAHFINMGRGSAVVETDLASALENEQIAGAMLDVFCTEPLESNDPLWQTKNLFISPHISGDYFGFEDDMVKLFLSNLEKYRSGSPMNNVVDKQLGFVRSER